MKIKCLLKNICICLLLFLMIATAGRAQLCQGSLGDPVVNITFGSGANPGPPLSAAATNYFFRAGDCPNDGSYTVINKTMSCFGDSWYTLLQDHTGNPNGYFMLVNASIQPNDFYVDTVRGLCPNTTYEYAAWIVNVLKTSACLGAGIQPNLTFSIQTLDGTLLHTFQTLDIAAESTPTWKQYGFFFKTPSDVTDVIVRIRNNAPGGCGNDLALDDITFRPCGPQVTATISELNTISEADICIDDSTVYNLKGDISQGYANPAYQWQLSLDGINWTDIAGATTTAFPRRPTTFGNYRYRLAVAESGNISSVKCRIVSNTIIIHVNDKPITSAASSSPVCESTSLSLTATGGTTYQWQGPNNYSGTGSPAAVNNISLTGAGKYYVTVTEKGCTQKDSVVAVVIPKPVANAGNDISICEGSNTQLNATGGDTYTWQPSTGLSDPNIANPLASPTDSTVYTLTVTSNATGCSANDEVEINVSRKPTASAGPDKIIVEGQSVQLNGTGSGTMVTYSWLPDAYITSGNTLQPFVQPPRDTTYTLFVQSAVGCGLAQDNVFIKVYKKVTVPNAFSPNKDGINELWKIQAIEAYPNADVVVFNRYSQAVFTTKSNAKFWDGTYNGKDLPVGTYYYVINLNAEIDLPKLKGWVVILR